MINNLIKRTIKSIPSPHFGGKANLILNFEIGIGVFIEDGSGNQIEQKRLVPCNASVKQDANNKEYELPGAIGLTSIVLIGRCLNPKVLPIEVVNETSCNAVLYHFIDSQEEAVSTTNGVFTFIPVVQNRFPAFTEKFGTEIKGYFSTVARV